MNGLKILLSLPFGFGGLAHYIRGDNRLAFMYATSFGNCVFGWMSDVFLIWTVYFFPSFWKQIRSIHSYIYVYTWSFLIGIFFTIHNIHHDTSMMTIIITCLLLCTSEISKIQSLCYICIGLPLFYILENEFGFEISPILLLCGLKYWINICFFIILKCYHWVFGWWFCVCLPKIKYKWISWFDCEYNEKFTTYSKIENFLIFGIVCCATCFWTYFVFMEEKFIQELIENDLISDYNPPLKALQYLESLLNGDYILVQNELLQNEL
jgi:hypothetical protein